MSDNQRQIASWSERPYTAHDKRHITVQHRVMAEYYPGVGADIRHEIKCPERGEDDWTGIEVWEFRDHGVQKHSAGDWKEIP